MSDPEIAERLRSIDEPGEWLHVDGPDGAHCVLWAHLPDTHGWLDDRILAVAPPGAPLSLAPDEDVSGWRLLLLENAGDDEPHPFAANWTTRCRAIDIVRRYPGLTRFVRDTGGERIRVLLASVVLPGDAAVNEDRAQEIHAEVRELRAELAEALPDVDWHKQGAERTSLNVRVRARLSDCIPADFAKAHPASGVPLSYIDGIDDADLDAMSAGLEPPLNWHGRPTG